MLMRLENRIPPFRYDRACQEIRSCSDYPVSLFDLRSTAGQVSPSIRDIRLLPTNSIRLRITPHSAISGIYFPMMVSKILNYSVLCIPYCYCSQGYYIETGNVACFWDGSRDGLCGLGIKLAIYEFLYSRIMKIKMWKGWKFSGCGPFGNVGNNVLQSALTIDWLNYYEWWASWDEWLSVRWLDQLVEQLTGAFHQCGTSFCKSLTIL